MPVCHYVPKVPRNAHLTKWPVCHKLGIKCQLGISRHSSHLVTNAIFLKEICIFHISQKNVKFSIHQTKKFDFSTFVSNVRGFILQNLCMTHSVWSPARSSLFWGVMKPELLHAFSIFVKGNVYLGHTKYKDWTDVNTWLWLKSTNLQKNSIE